MRCWTYSLRLLLQPGDVYFTFITMGQVKLEVLIKALVLNLFIIPGISRRRGSQMSNLSTTDHRETLSVGELAWTCVDEVQHYYSCDQDLILSNDYRTESYSSFIAEIDHLLFKLHQELFNKLPRNIICCFFCFFLFILKLGDKGAAVPNVDHDSLHARVLGKLPVK